MSIRLIQCLRKVRALSLSLMGWCFLIYLWYRFMISHDNLHITLNAFKIIGVFAVFLFILYFLWNNFNKEKPINKSDFNYHFIRYKAKVWTWVEITYDDNDNLVNTRERYMIICRQKEQNLSSTKKLSYSAVLIRDGYIKEAIGLLRQVLYDPYLGQLARKIADSELNLIFTDIDGLKKLNGD